MAATLFPINKSNKSFINTIDYCKKLTRVTDCALGNNPQISQMLSNIYIYMYVAICFDYTLLKHRSTPSSQTSLEKTLCAFKEDHMEWKHEETTQSYCRLGTI